MTRDCSRLCTVWNAYKCLNENSTVALCDEYPINFSLLEFKSQNQKQSNKFENLLVKNEKELRENISVCAQVKIATVWMV